MTRTRFEYLIGNARVVYELFWISNCGTIFLSVRTLSVLLLAQTLSHFLLSASLSCLRAKNCGNTQMMTRDLFIISLFCHRMQAFKSFTVMHLQLWQHHQLSVHVHSNSLLAEALEQALKPLKFSFFFLLTWSPSQLLQNNHSRFHRFWNKTAETELFSWFFYIRAVASANIPTIKNLFHYSLFNSLQWNI